MVQLAYDAGSDSSRKTACHLGRLASASHQMISFTWLCRMLACESVAQKKSYFLRLELTRNLTITKNPHD
jgi:hypothetical protein